MTFEILLTALLALGRPGPMLQIQQAVVGSQQPTRDKTAVPTAGTASIRGRVTNADGRPLRRAQLRLTGDALDGAQTATTNSQGHFEIRDLPAGRYTLTATRAGYLPTTYGESWSGDAGEPIEVFDGAAVENIDLMLPRTGVIAGMVLDEAGEPDAGATVVPLQMRFLNGKRRPVPVTSAVSDDVGQYRLSGLPPGEYYIEAVSREKWETDPPEKKMMGFLPTFYPSAQNAGEAQAVRLKLAQQMTGIDVGLIAGKLVTISGTALDPQGLPLAGDTVGVSLVPQGDTFASYATAGSAKTAPDGSFVVRDVSPGEYTLHVQTQPATGTPESTQTSIAASTDIQGVELVTSAASSVSGRVVLDSGSALPSNCPLTRLRVTGRLVDDTGHVNLGGFRANGGTVSDDGSFTVQSVAGQTRFTVAPLPPGWAVKRVDYNGADILAIGIDSHGQTLDGLVITVTDRLPTVTGTLRDDKGNPAPTAAAIIFPEDATLWDSGLNTVRIARVDQLGVFSCRALRPGTYLAIAVPAVNGNDWMDPQFLESLRSRATEVMLKEGDTKQLNLVVVNVGTQ